MAARISTAVGKTTKTDLESYRETSGSVGLTIILCTHFVTFVGLCPSNFGCFFIDRITNTPM